MDAHLLQETITVADATALSGLSSCSHYATTITTAVDAVVATVSVLAVVMTAAVVNGLSFFCSCSAADAANKIFRAGLDPARIFLRLFFLKLSTLHTIW